ncbi:MAG: organomercurial lyase [Candidatus Limnocylindria bacterium]
MTSLLRRVRLHIFEHFLELGAPPVVEGLMREFSVSRAEATDALRELAAARHIALVPGTDRILMAFPFSAVATPFRVTARGQTYFANCSWDAIAFHTMLGEEIRVESACHHCAAPIRVEMADGRARVVDPSEALVHLALPPARWWDDIVTTCGSTMVFFCSAAHRDASDLCGPANATASLAPDLVHALSGPIYANKLAIDYQRPSREALLDHFAAIGLIGEYWQL